MGDAGAKRAWVGRVLGLEVSAGLTGAGGPAAGATTTRAIWLAAKEAVDARLEVLARELRSYGDPDLDDVAEYGLFGVSGGGETVKLTAALLDLERADPPARDAAAAAAAEAVRAYRSGVLEGNDLVDLLDDNPFDIEMGLHRTLDAALTQIEQALA